MMSLCIHIYRIHYIITNGEHVCANVLSLFLDVFCIGVAAVLGFRHVVSSVIWFAFANVLWRRSTADAVGAPRSLFVVVRLFDIALDNGCSAYCAQ